MANTTTTRGGGSTMKLMDGKEMITLSNCSFGECSSAKEKGGMVSVVGCVGVRMEMCEFDGKREESERRGGRGGRGGEEGESVKWNKEGKSFNVLKEEICRWNGSMVDLERSTMELRETTMRNSKKGGLSVSEGNVKIEKGEFENNNPSIEDYPSVRRNMLCSDSAEVNIMSLKGGDGVLPDSSMWILNDGCMLKGIVEERASPLFIPVLEDVSVNENGRNAMIKFKGTLFVPCDLSFRVVYKTGDVEMIETYPFEEDSFVSETEVIGMIPSENISTIADETEVSVMILYGKQLAATSPQILKNKSESRTNGNEKLAEGGNGKFSSSTVIIIILVVLLFIVLLVSIFVTIRWRKQKRRTVELEVIVEDTVKKDPKAFEMVTMEMSPEEQWRRAEREAEKKNEERIKKRVNEKSLGHSESSENLLSESGSTEYILGRDSDKIPQWMLEKVDEEEDDISRKRTPSPSISSTSSTDTSDTESTFVRGEDLCPTTSSMSNLVDAMACSSPHEKLIVDLRDSLFMLLHGLNKTKEMEIGTLQEREVTAAQILFWVDNLALRSFDEMNNPLQSLTNLSPHIVLFSEHMVICIALHSDCSSSDSDSSSISSSTVVTSTSDDDDDDRDSLPSSAFEDEDALKKECLRWKAPELMANKKMEAKKKAVAFSIGMMLWECLTLDVPFGEYEADVAGQKIVNGERPDLSEIEGTTYSRLVRSAVAQNKDDRPSLFGMKREFFQHFPSGATMVTVSDAIDCTEDTKIVCASLIIDTQWS
ncbi:uncharacterized protein MONOS_7769 [Monocercomonoides exilis]|uniref:uncharacterized protein n=1 Tax=Monocercomonoides exilis TaxID=2049356 RepID=UPI003559BE21|nr:hypothetical protein MONOS_7769 [Monocercomonoides exilis]|eukprot:MONOS_7769.1-p1 / transcript=MONOS_7769.1 / gene=MONOS_7769 / organism=Monocercomonoides_exilis_PA203 / gene_product=unspecified product / transcript_product=unspecified product / location=Mono_scaffold00274:37722-40019(+) / protein_length=765 / sequence_SO=supercontig / SO=protein_coding / is_pseudo=false